MTWLLRNRRDREDFYLRFGLNTVGRAGQRDIKIRNIPGLSRHHCDIIAELDRAIVIDRGSRLGVWVNQQKIRQNKKINLSSGDIITLGIDINSLGKEKRSLYEKLSYELIRSNGKIKEEQTEQTEEEEEEEEEEETSESGEMKYEEEEEGEEDMIIDLTSSDDEEEMPLSQLKKIQKPALFTKQHLSDALASVYSTPKPQQTMIIKPPIDLNKTNNTNAMIPKSANNDKIPVAVGDSPHQHHFAPTTRDEDHFEKMILTILNWNCNNVRNLNYNRTVKSIPDKTFGDYDNYKSLYTDLIECTAWYWLKLTFVYWNKSVPLIVEKVGSVSNGTLLKCRFAPPNNKSILTPDQVLLVNIGQDRRFYAYVTNIFEDSSFHLKTSIKSLDVYTVLNAIGICPIDYLANHFRSIYSIENIRITNGIVHPASLAGMTPKGQQRNTCPYGDTKRCTRPLSQKQYEIFWDLYNNSLDAIISTTRKEFVTIVDGVPGSGKSRILVELIVALTLTNATNGKPIRILVTAASNGVVDMLANELLQIRLNQNSIGATKLNLLRYGTLSTIYKAINAYNPKNLTKDLRDKSTHRMRYMELIQNTNIVFCHPTDMYNLKSRYVSKFDICLMDNAENIIEYAAISPVQFDPKVFILFGDHRMKSINTFNFNEMFADKNLNQTLFQRLLNHKMNKNMLILSLQHSHRFGMEMNHFLSRNFYNNNMLQNNIINDNGYPLVGFRMFHQNNDKFIPSLLLHMFNDAKPSKYTYQIIHPPDVDTNFNFIPPQIKKYLHITPNMQCLHSEVDIVIIWMNDSCLKHNRYSLEKLLHAMTRPKRTLIIAGVLPINSMRWMPIVHYARENDKFTIVDNHYKLVQKVLKNHNFN